ncbi:MAG: hypothetical protein COA99_04670 [Moraxellaceae bacterium]|nr:MAG: hypothetical protein COA99_04670 [Moraxellaceae bacterium]
MENSIQMIFMKENSRGQKPVISGGALMELGTLMKRIVTFLFFKVKIAKNWSVLRGNYYRVIVVWRALRGGGLHFFRASGSKKCFGLNFCFITTLTIKYRLCFDGCKGL